MLLPLPLLKATFHVEQILFGVSKAADGILAARFRDAEPDLARDRGR
jgi:hypothetical protein